MSSCRGQKNMLVPCGFCQSMSTKNSARTIYGLLFVLRFVTFSKWNNLWTDIRPKVVELLDQRNIQHSSIDLVRFSWVEENLSVEENQDDEDDENDDKDDDEDDDEDDNNSEISAYGTVVTTLSRFGWESYQILSPARSHSTLPTTSSVSSRSTVFLMSTLRTVSQWLGASVVPNCSHPSGMEIPSRPSSIRSLLHLAYLSLA